MNKTYSAYITPQMEDVARHLVLNKYQIVIDITLEVQKFLDQELDPIESFPDRFIDFVTVCVRQHCIDNLSNLSYDDFISGFDYDFINHMTGDYFYDAEKYSFTSQN